MSSRFKTPEICEKVIESFHGKQVGEGKDSTILQLRYADTDQQKTLKMETAQRRQFKANEYNVAVNGPDSPYRFDSPLSTFFQSPLQVRAPGHLTGQSPESQASIEFSSYLQQPSAAHEAPRGKVQFGALPSHGIHVPAGAKVQISAPPAQLRQSSRIKIESPRESTDSNTTVTTNLSSDSEDETLVCKTSPETSCSVEVVLSPTKSKL